jgi:hypothetical protein
MNKMTVLYEHSYWYLILAFSYYKSTVSACVKWIVLISSEFTSNLIVKFTNAKERVQEMYFDWIGFGWIRFLEAFFRTRICVDA